MHPSNTPASTQRRANCTPATAARLARDLMRLCLLMERRYPPYGKWLGCEVPPRPSGSGGAFARTAVGTRLSPVLTAALAATDWPTRERHLAQARSSRAGTTGSA
ncbi:hypothetical protein AQI70_23680 [Streptomyces curacoi]|uniref:DUF4037 domain-containing protein n=1 Tax=Streptomyces curacoi TaxID=146536 RepID=A0A124GYS0_9ACTN|nr:hypothetical protein AQI70_23680 [Streptomyces curacoi]